MMRMNKRGLVEDWADLVFNVFLGLFLFFFLNGILQEDARAKEQQTQMNLELLQAEEIMQTYLRTPTEGMIMAELIRQSWHDEAAFLQLKTVTQEIITASNNPLFQGVSLEDPETQFRQEVFFKAPSSTYTTLYYTYILSTSDGKGIIIHLYQGRSS